MNSWNVWDSMFVVDNSILNLYIIWKIHPYQSTDQTAVMPSQMFLRSSEYLIHQVPFRWFTILVPFVVFLPCSQCPKCIRESSLQVRRIVYVCFISSLPLVSFPGLDWNWHVDERPPSRDSLTPPAHRMCIFRKPKYTTVWYNIAFYHEYSTQWYMMYCLITVHD